MTDVTGQKGLNCVCGDSDHNLLRQWAGGDLGSPGQCLECFQMLFPAGNTGFRKVQNKLAILFACSECMGANPTSPMLEN